MKKINDDWTPQILGHIIQRVVKYDSCQHH